MDWRIVDRVIRHEMGDPAYLHDCEGPQGPPASQIVAAIRRELDRRGIPHPPEHRLRRRVGEVSYLPPAEAPAED